MAARSSPRSPSENRRRRAGSGSASAQAASPEQKLVEAVIELMEAGTAPWRRPWDGRSGGHHLNLLSGRRYRGANPVLLTFGMHLRGSALPYWCGFAEAKARGFVPRKGSKAVAIVRPQVQGRSTPTESSPTAHGQPSPGPGEPASAPAAGDQQVGAQERTWIRYKPLPLFNAADLVGPGLEELIEQRRFSEGLGRRSEPERLAAAEAVLGAWPVPVSDGGEQACYWPEADRIQLPDRCAFHSAAAYYATWAHEGIHSTGHCQRLGRDLGGDFGSEAYAREELVAELGAVLLGDRLEIGSDSANHAAYLAHWVQLLRQSPRLLFQVLSEARRAADLICPEAMGTDADRA
jgi:antirestriction protein ArdC